MGSKSSKVSGHTPDSKGDMQDTKNEKKQSVPRKRKLTLDPHFYQGDGSLAAIVEKNGNKNGNVSNHSVYSIRSAVSALHHSSSLELIQHEDFEYPFENVVFEGGGNKGLAYAGAVRELERVGIWQNIRRIGGASAGAMWATLLAIGYSSYDIEEYMNMNLKKYFLDAGCGSCSLFPNVLRHFGWHPARKLFEWFGDRIEEMTGDADTTFKQLYELTGKELCIVVTNLSLMDAEYCHIKTTPNMPIRTAMRMSIAIPGLFGAVRCKRYGHDEIYVDGGVLCNYPIHCFDGWWLSLKSEDSMLRRLQPLEDIGKLWDKKERFGTYNHKTIGMMLYKSDDHDVMVSKLQKRTGLEEPIYRPNTRLARKRKQIKEKREAAMVRHGIVTSAMSGFLRLLSENNLDNNATISRDELRHAFAQNPNYFTETHKKELFEDLCTADEIFDHLNHNNDDEISFDELQIFAEKKGVAIQSNFQGYSRRDIKGFPDFLTALQETLLVNVKRVFVTEQDIDRTIGVDTVYIDTADFDLEADDKKFLLDQGVRAVRSFLRHYVHKNDPPLKADIRGVTDTQSTIKYDDVF